MTVAERCIVRCDIATGMGRAVEARDRDVGRTSPLARQHPSYCDFLEVKREYVQNCCVLDCVTQCSQSAAYLYQQFLQVLHIEFVTMGPLRHAQRRLLRVVLL